MIKEVLLTGQQNALTGKEICALLQINARTLTQMVEAERRHGAPICASTDSNRPGYFLAADKAEMEQFCRSLDHRAREIRKTRRACLKSLDDLPAAAR